MAKKNGKWRYATILVVGYTVRIQAQTTECISCPPNTGLQVNKYVFFIHFHLNEEENSLPFVHAFPCIWGCDWISNIYCCCSQEWWTMAVWRKGSFHVRKAVLYLGHSFNCMPIPSVMVTGRNRKQKSTFTQILWVSPHHFSEYIHLVRLFFTDNSSKNALFLLLCASLSYSSLCRVRFCTSNAWEVHEASKVKSRSGNEKQYSSSTNPPAALTKPSQELYRKCDNIQNWTLFLL